MKELNCKNCNSTDFEYKGGIWVCNSCGSKFLPEKGEKPEKSQEEKLVEKLVKKNDKICDADPFIYDICGFSIHGMKAIVENNPGFMGRIEKLHKTFKEWGVVLI